MLRIRLTPSFDFCAVGRGKPLPYGGGGEMRGCPSQSRRQADATAPPEGGAKSDGICGEGGECIYPHQYAAEQCSALRGNP